MCGVTNSLRISYVDPLVGGFRNIFSRASVLNVDPVDDDPDGSDIEEMVVIAGDDGAKTKISKIWAT